MCATDVLITSFDPAKLAAAPSWAEAADLSSMTGTTAEQIAKQLDVNQMYAVYFGLEDYKLHEEEASIAIASPTQSGRNVVSAIMRYGRATEMRLKKVTTEDGRVGVTFDYYVLRVDLVPPHMSAAGIRMRVALDAMIEALPMSETQKKWSKRRFKECWELTNKKKNFFNVFGGTKQEMELLLLKMEVRAKQSWEAMAEVQATEGYMYCVLEEWWQEFNMKIKDGPLVRTTQGKWYTHMPLSYTQAAKDLTTQWKLAEMEVYGENALRLVSHSARRATTHRARVKILAADFPVALIDELIDRHFRWKPDSGGQRKEYTGHLSIEQRLMVTLFM
jgi:hypothetical protein